MHSHGFFSLHLHWTYDFQWFSGPHIFNKSWHCWGWKPLSRAHCWLMFNLMSTKTPISFSAKLLSSWFSPSMYWCLGLFFHRCRTLQFSLLNFMRFLSTSLEFPPNSPGCWGSSDWQHNPLAYQPLPQFCVTCKFVEVHSATSSTSPSKNKTRPSIDTWDTPLVTGLQLGFVSLITTLWTWLFSQFSIHLSVFSSHPYINILAMSA